jgi:hypothetical protein
MICRTASRNRAAAQSSMSCSSSASNEISSVYSRGHKCSLKFTAHAKQ